MESLIENLVVDLVGIEFGDILFFIVGEEVCMVNELINVI